MQTSATPADAAAALRAAHRSVDIGPWGNIPTYIVDRTDLVDPAVAAIQEDLDSERKNSADGIAVVGADMEWVPEKRTGKAKDIPFVQRPDDFATFQVALLQISTGRAVYLFRMCAFEQETSDDDEGSAEEAEEEQGDGGAAFEAAAAAKTRVCVCPPALAALLSGSPAAPTLGQGSGDDAATAAATIAAASPQLHLLFAGVGIDGDRTRFGRDFDGVALGKCIDIVAAYRALAGTADAASLLRAAGGASAEAGETMPARIVAAGSDPACRSLSDFSQRVLGFDMPKDLAVTCSNWTQRALSDAQLQYAAADAWVSRQLIMVLLERFGYVASAPQASPADGDSARLPLRPPGSLAAFAATCTPLKPIAPAKAKTKTAAAGGGSGGRGGPRKPPGGYAGRKQPYYGNIKVLAPAGPDAIDPATGEPRVLFTVSVAKADWYLKEGLATVVEEGVKLADTSYTGRVIQLKFQPNLHRGVEDQELRPDAAFFAADKRNCCVVCATNDPPGGVVRFFVVPQAYRRFFPREFVNHNSFDIVLVCVTCMKRVNVVYESERKRLEDEFKYPISWHSSKAMEATKKAVEAAEAPSREATANSDDDDGDVNLDNEDAATAQAATASVAPGFVIAEHNRTILNMTKAATALIMAVVARESPAASTRAKGKKVDLPPDRQAALLSTIDSSLPLYIFPDAASAVDDGTSNYKGRPHWMDKYWIGLKAMEGIEVDRPIPWPDASSPSDDGAPAVCPNGTTWRDVYNVMRADRWKVKLRTSSTSDSAEQPLDVTTDGANQGGARIAAMGASHFEYVVNEILRASIAEPKDADADSVTDEDRHWLAQRLRPAAPDNAGRPDSTTAASGGDDAGAPLSSNADGAPLSGKPGRGPNTPRAALKAVCRFIYRWRRLFVDQLAPTAMPVGWAPEQGLIGLKDDDDDNSSGRREAAMRCAADNDVTTDAAEQRRRAEELRPRSP